MGLYLMRLDAGLIGLICRGAMLGSGGRGLGRWFAIFVPRVDLAPVICRLLCTSASSVPGPGGEGFPPCVLEDRYA
jgi:hypothetical protein